MFFRARGIRPTGPQPRKKAVSTSAPKCCLLTVFLSPPEAFGTTFGDTQRPTQDYPTGNPPYSAFVEQAYPIQNPLFVPPYSPPQVRISRNFHEIQIQ